jgi:hypothetical protein
MQNFYKVFPELKMVDVSRFTPVKEEFNGTNHLNIVVTGRLTSPENHSRDNISPTLVCDVTCNAEVNARHRGLTAVRGIAVLTAKAIIHHPALSNFRLRGIAIGNGWIDPREQYQGYVDFAYTKGLIKEGTKVRVLTAHPPAELNTPSDRSAAAITGGGEPRGANGSV